MPAEGEAVGDTGPGEEKPKDAAKASPGPTKAKTYPVDPATCSHKFPSGNWQKWDDEDRCPKCGTPKLVAMEATTADLGPA